MIADIEITEKSFGDKILMSHIKFSVDDGEKIGIIGRNGVGKSTLFGILSGLDTDFTGSVVFRRGVTVASTAQEHHGLGEITVMNYVLNGLPEYTELKNIIDTYPGILLFFNEPVFLYFNYFLEKFVSFNFIRYILLAVTIT